MVKKKRKSPFRHSVRRFTRANGTVVETFKRGKGKKPREQMTGGGRKPSTRKPSRRSTRKATPRKPRARKGLRAPKTPFRNFNVRVTFPDGRSESVPGVNATSYAGAIDKGLTKRERGDAPKSILIRRVV